MTEKKTTPRLEVYLDRSVLIEDGKSPEIFIEGETSAEAKKRLASIKSALEAGYLDKLFESPNLR